MIFEKLQKIAEEYNILEEKLADPEVYSNIDEAQKIAKERSALNPIIEIYKTLDQAYKNLKEAEKILNEEKDEEIITLAKEELKESKIIIKEYEEKARIALLPKDPYDNRNIILEIRPAAGGDEASIFAGEMGRMYLKYAENQGWKTEILSWQEAEHSGSIKLMSLQISGNSVYSGMKFESGVHRVQRIPATESQGRVHTSTITVAVMPEAEEKDIVIRTEDLDIGTFRASGAGGQHVNKTESAIRIKHNPSGIVVACQESPSQHRNRDIAMQMLRSKILHEQEHKAAQKRSAERSSQIGSGDRSEKIRTYNFPQDRLTDHRINKNFSNLPGILAGGIDDIIESLLLEDQTRKLAAYAS
jgi:peptide chain release factor 1